jgi:hypothetical protein
MMLRAKLLAAVATTAAAGSTAAYLTIASPNAGTAGDSAPGDRPASSSAPGPSTPDAGPDDVKLCVGSGRILHATPEGSESCPDGQEELQLAWGADERVCELCDPFKDPPSGEPQSDSRALDAIERRIRDLENAAYFEVVNKNEQTIFRVGPGGIRVFNGNGTAVAALGISELGGYFTGRSATGPFEASIGASGSSAGVRLFDTGLPRVEVGTRNGPFALRFPSAVGMLAGIGQTRAGTGAVLAGTLPGAVRASFTVTDGRGMASMIKEAGNGGAALTEATIGGGLLDIANARGNSAVKMGHNAHRYGVVLAGPVLGMPVVPRSGIPGSYFMGCASGERPACAPQVE